MNNNNVTTVCRYLLYDVNNIEVLNTYEPLYFIYRY